METSANHDDKLGPSNQPNRSRSTGPKTEAGKRVSAQNAVKFGFFSTKALLPGESAEEFAEFQAAVQQQLAPRNAMEAHVVEQYVPLAWRLRRLPEMEASAFTRYGISVQGNQCGPGFALVASVQSDNILGQLARYEATLRKSAFKYLDLLRALRREGWEQESPVIEVELVKESPPSPAPSSPDAAEVGTETAAPTKPESDPGRGGPQLEPKDDGGQKL